MCIEAIGAVCAHQGAGRTACGRCFAQGEAAALNEALNKIALLEQQVAIVEELQLHMEEQEELITSLQELVVANRKDQVRGRRASSCVPSSPKGGGREGLASACRSSFPWWCVQADESSLLKVQINDLRSALAAAESRLIAQSRELETRSADGEAREQEAVTRAVGEMQVSTPSLLIPTRGEEDPPLGAAPAHTHHRVATAWWPCGNAGPA